jgi:hypothetical protein
LRRPPSLAQQILSVHQTGLTSADVEAAGEPVTRHVERLLRLGIQAHAELEEVLHLGPDLEADPRTAHPSRARDGDRVVEKHLVPAYLNEERGAGGGQLRGIGQGGRGGDIGRIVACQVLRGHPQQAGSAALQVDVGAAVEARSRAGEVRPRRHQIGGRRPRQIAAVQLEECGQHQAAAGRLARESDARGREPLLEQPVVAVDGGVHVGGERVLRGERVVQRQYPHAGLMSSACSPAARCSARGSSAIGGADRNSSANFSASGLAIATLLIRRRRPVPVSGQAGVLSLQLFEDITGGGRAPGVHVGRGGDAGGVAGGQRRAHDPQ